MGISLARFLAAHAAAGRAARTGIVPSLTPDIFAGTAPLCDDMRQQLERASSICADLRAARAVRDLEAMQSAADALGDSLAAIARMHGSLQGVMRQYQDYLAEADHD